jgi:hypothetical protein
LDNKQSEEIDRNTNLMSTEVAPDDFEFVYKKLEKYQKY